MIRSTHHSTRESILHGDGVAYHASIFLILLLVGLSTQPCAAQTGGKVPRVSVVQPVQKTLVYSLPSKPAEIHAAQEATLYARTNGYLQQILVDFGDAVEKDQLIAVLEAPELQDEVRRAEAQLLEASAQLGAARANAAGGDSQIIAAKAGHVQAEAAVLQAGAELEKARAILHAELIHLNRMIQLHDQDAATDAQLESARRDHSQALGDVDIGEKGVTSAKAMAGAAAAKIQVAESQKEALVSLVAVAEAAIASANARVDLATTMVGYTRIQAPFSGIITERFLDPGAAVVTSSSSKTTAIVSIKDMSHLRVFVQIPEPDVPYIQQGHAATVTCSAIPNQKFQGTVSRISKSLDRRTRTMKVEILLENQQGQIFPGMFATVDFQLIERENAWTLPAQALLGTRGEYHVYCVVGGTCQVVPIKIGLDDGATVEITEGLSGTEQVILIGKGLVQEGDRVEAVGANP
ncbi:MAG: efflux RND transporter periplasmic adaptor subunit [Planctomycetes bacterium]|nr:efflux RND transporter periplasmic adaptor subunit [Planctomycetota bacterium]MBT6452485.1 efflux RND transporter periplasmic adaptor subunit [Planctomycetota bacterium]MBT6541239.1 efflux RND transporter periplasmic adaptor subunit [Planctomycetota bacterium]MBT6783770.1 efflux RND transporter periplasmic adaptor subunit [Planctomycetota bacterium]MBT6969050.1 efflux RND transporter periplasmic adaptor subunit [Planctomycetota bacterium]